MGRITRRHPVITRALRRQAVITGIPAEVLAERIARERARERAIRRIARR